jgi:hypothetical protein
MIRSHHIQIDVAWALRKDTAFLACMLRRETGDAVTGEEVRARLRVAQACGYVVLPVCPAHDARGYCTGHVVEERRGSDK